MRQRIVGGIIGGKGALERVVFQVEGGSLLNALVLNAIDK